MDILLLVTIERFVYPSHGADIYMLFEYYFGSYESLLFLQHLLRIT